MNINNELELLAPAGSMESVTAAVNGGCDAIYLGGKSFNARAYASNFSNEDLKSVIDYCHLRGVKVLITLNILYKDTEINDVLAFVSDIYQYGADAFILQDIGLFNVIKDNFPDIRLHASTQLTTHNLGAVLQLKDMGFHRVVLSRELSLEEINYISQHKGDIELEAFIHGALCVCYSGRCLMSSIIGERSGNRGRCAQPCRLKYKLVSDNNIISNGYLLSPKDISTIDILDKILTSGLTSLKIEGRMKSPEYVSQVVSTYRKYINQTSISYLSVEKKDKKELMQIFNRGGSSSQGYYNNWSGTDMISSSPKSSGIRIGTVTSYNYKNKKCSISLTDNVIPGDGIEIWTQSPEHTGTGISKPANSGDTITLNISGQVSVGDAVYKSYDKALNDKLSKTYSNHIRQQTIYADIKAKIGEPLVLTLNAPNNVSVTETGEILTQAENQPVTEERLLAQLSKTGGTPFSFSFQNIDIDNNIYISMSSLNNIRRNAVDSLSKAIISYYDRPYISAAYNRAEFPLTDVSQITVYTTTTEQYQVALESMASRIYIELTDEVFHNIDYYITSAHSCSKELFAAMPRIYRYTAEDKYHNYLQQLESTALDGYLIRNYGIPDTNKKIALDYTFNVFNTASFEALSSMSDTVTLSPELNIQELKPMCNSNTEVYVYGRLPLMTTHQCPIGLYAGQKQKGKYCSQKSNDNRYYLRDRKNIDFPIVTDCNNCTAVILNTNPIYLLNKYRDMCSLKTGFYRISLTTENAQLSRTILYSYHRLLSGLEPDETVENLNTMLKNTTTNGHFYRGVL